MNNDLNNNILDRVSLNNVEFIKFINKFYKIFLFNGKKSMSVRYIDKVFFALKMKFDGNQFIYLNQIFKNLIPLISYSYKKVGNRVEVIPAAAFGNRRFVLLIDWIFRNLKSKTNVLGVQLEHFIEILIDAYSRKGSAMNNKLDYYQKAFTGRSHLVKKVNKKKRLMNNDFFLNSKEDSYLWKSSINYGSIFKKK